MDRGRYRRFTCAACATVATFAALHLVFLESRDVVIGADHSQLHLEQHWLGPEIDFPPGEQYTGLPPYLRPAMQRHILGTGR